MPIILARALLPLFLLLLLLSLSLDMLKGLQQTISILRTLARPHFPTRVATYSSTSALRAVKGSSPGTRKRTWARKPNPNLPLVKEAIARDPNFPWTIDEEIILTIESVSNNGDGVGKCIVKNSDGTEGGWVVFVPFTIAGETVSVRISKNNKRYSEGRLHRLIDTSPHRVEPQCPYFMQCSGCQYQHMSGNHSREVKGGQVRTALERIGGVDRGTLARVVRAVVGAGEHYGYRTKLTPHLERRGGRAVLGFIGTGGALVDVHRCEIASELINTKYAQTRQEQLALRSEEEEGGDAKKTLLFRDCGNGVEVSGSRNVTESIAGVNFRFQVKICIYLMIWV